MVCHIAGFFVAQMRTPEVTQSVNKTKLISDRHYGNRTDLSTDTGTSTGTSPRSTMKDEKEKREKETMSSICNGEWP